MPEIPKAIVKVEFDDKGTYQFYFDGAWNDERLKIARAVIDKIEAKIKEANELPGA